MRELERRVLLSVLDRKWREHLYEMDYLREGIGLRAYSQRDPLVEYQREGFDMFARHDGRHQGGVRRLPVQPRGRRSRTRPSEAEHGSRRSRSVRALGRRPAASLRAHDHAARSAPRVSTRPKRPQNLSYSAPSEDGEAEVHGAARQPVAPTTRSPAPAATPSAPAARARSTRSATARPAARPA